LDHAFVQQLATVVDQGVLDHENIRYRNFMTNGHRDSVSFLIVLTLACKKIG